MTERFKGKSGLMLAEDYLQSFHAVTYPVDVFELCRREGIYLLPYSMQKAKDCADILKLRCLMERTDGFCVKLAGEYNVFWDDCRSLDRQRSTIAHELGHILLGHLDDSESISDCREFMADSFAFHLLFPNFIN